MSDEESGCVFRIYTQVVNLPINIVRPIHNLSTSDHVWLDWKSNHEVSAEVLIVRDKDRATKRWSINDEIRCTVAAAQ